MLENPPFWFSTLPTHVLNLKVSHFCTLIVQALSGMSQAITVTSIRSKDPVNELSLVKAKSTTKQDVYPPERYYPHDNNYNDPNYPHPYPYNPNYDQSYGNCPWDPNYGYPAWCNPWNHGNNNGRGAGRLPIVDTEAAVGRHVESVHHQR